MERSVSTGFHEIPKTGQLMPVNLFANSVNLIMCTSFHFYTHYINLQSIKQSFYAPIILLNNCNSTSFTPEALNTKPTAIKAITKNPISLENSRLNPRYTPITTIAINTRLCALLKNSCISSVQNSLFLAPFHHFNFSVCGCSCLHKTHHNYAESCSKREQE